MNKNEVNTVTNRAFGDLVSFSVGFMYLFKYRCGNISYK